MIIAAAIHNILELLVSAMAGVLVILLVVLYGHTRSIDGGWFELVQALLAVTALGLLLWTGCPA